MKTLYDLQQMKETPCFPFGNSYTFFIARLADCYLSKTDGIARIEHELHEWVPEARACIWKLVAAEIRAAGIEDFDPDFAAEVIL